MKPGPFPLVTSVAVFLLASALAFSRPELGKWRIILPTLLGTVTFVWASRMRRGTEAVITRHDYALVAPAIGGTVGGLLEKLKARGYQVDAQAIDDENKATGVAAAGQGLGGAALRLRDARAKAELGGVTMRLRREESGALVGFLEADDTGPGIYDELAQFAIVALGEEIPGLEFTKMQKNVEKRPAAALLAELPNAPYGLSLLG